MVRFRSTLRLKLRLLDSQTDLLGYSISHCQGWIKGANGFDKQLKTEATFPTALLYFHRIACLAIFSELFPW